MLKPNVLPDLSTESCATYPVIVSATIHMDQASMIMTSCKAHGSHYNALYSILLA